MNDPIKELQDFLSLIEADEKVLVQSPVDTGQLQKLQKMRAVVNNEIAIIEEIFKTLSVLENKLDEAIDRVEDEIERIATNE